MLKSLKPLGYLLLIYVSSINYVHATRSSYIPHMRSFLQNIKWVMEHTTKQTQQHCYDAREMFAFTGGTTIVDGYLPIGLSDRYFADITVTSDCDLQFTINTTIQDSSGYTIPVPSLVKGKKILLHPVVFGPSDGNQWECYTNIDNSSIFKGQSAPSENSISIISLYPDNLYTGNCVYKASPF